MLPKTVNQRWQCDVGRRWFKFLPTLAHPPVIAVMSPVVSLVEHHTCSILHTYIHLVYISVALIGLRRWIVYSRCPATEINCSQFGVKSQFTDLPAVYTSSLPYLTHICEDFLLLEKESKFIFMLFIRNYTWGYQVISGGVGWKREILWDDVIARGRWRHRTWYLPFFLCFTQQV